jgi:hypothetical protein
VTRDPVSGSPNSSVKTEPWSVQAGPARSPASACSRRRLVLRRERDEFLEGPERATPHHHPVDQPVPGQGGRVPDGWEDQLN